jgi:hypothetical protein
MASFSMIVYVSVRLACLQALLVIVVEKFFLKIPRVAGKIERFYINIVQGLMNLVFKRPMRKHIDIAI